MSTYADIQQRIADDYINRSDFTNQIKRAILAAIRFYERRRWRFNETVTSIATVAGQNYIALPSNFLIFDALQISASGSLLPMDPIDLGGLLVMQNTSATGIPSHYNIRQNRIGIAVPPDSAYSCPLYYIKSLDALSADADSNAWTDGLYQDLIAYHAAKQIWANTLRNKQEALTYAALERDTLTQLSMDQMQFNHTGLKPTQF
ncbi:MAG TPA: hypothetical protein VF443_07330 [Nitrospira sp.]